MRPAALHTISDLESEDAEPFEPDAGGHARAWSGPPRGVGHRCVGPPRGDERRNGDRAWRTSRGAERDAGKWRGDPPLDMQQRGAAPAPRAEVVAGQGA